MNDWLAPCRLFQRAPLSVTQSLFVCHVSVADLSSASERRVRPCSAVCHGRAGDRHRRDRRLHVRGRRHDALAAGRAGRCTQRFHVCSGQTRRSPRTGAERSGGDLAGRGNIYWKADFGQVVERDERKSCKQGGSAGQHRRRRGCLINGAVAILPRKNAKAWA
jgi:hypothetical protein